MGNAYTNGPPAFTGTEVLPNGDFDWNLEIDLNGPARLVAKELGWTKRQALISIVESLGERVGESLQLFFFEFVRTHRSNSSGPSQGRPGPTDKRGRMMGRTTTRPRQSGGSSSTRRPAKQSSSRRSKP